MQFCCTDRGCVPYSISILFHLVWSVRCACTAASRTCIPAVTWLTHSIYIGHTPGTSWLVVSRHTSSFHRANFSTKEQQDSSALVPATTKHNAWRCILHIAIGLWCAQGRNDGFHVYWWGVIQAGRTRSKDRDDLDLSISTKDRDRRHIRSRLKIEIDADFSWSSIQTIGVKIDLCEGDLDPDLQHWTQVMMHQVHSVQVLSCMIYSYEVSCSWYIHNRTMLPGRAIQLGHRKQSLHYFV